MKRTMKKLVNTSLVGLLVLGTPITALARKQTAMKEEVVYGMLQGNGSVKEAYVVNIFDEPGKIIDYGNYREVKNMTSEDEVQLNGNQVNVDNTEEALYYEGILNSNELPWDITLQYFIDGTEYSAEEVAGKSGTLEIKMDIEENPAVDSFFYDNYGVQATVVLDTKIAKNIQAEDATIANVGRNKQLSYTILPGNGADISIQADVEDFEMEAVSINGIHLNLGIDFDIEDADLMDKVEELLSGVNQLDTGAQDLKEGATTLTEGTTELSSGAKKLNNGTVELNQGANDLESEIHAINQALETLDSQSIALTDGSAEFKAALVEVQSRLSDVSIEAGKLKELNNASSEIQQGISELNENLRLLNESVGYDQYKGKVKEQGLDLDELQAGNEQALSTINPLIEKIKGFAGKLQDLSGIPGLESLGEELEELINGLSGIETLLQGNQAALQSTEVYIDEVSHSIDQLYQGSAGLNESYKQFDVAISELIGSLNQLIGKLPELTQAIHTLVEKYSELDAGVNQYTDGVAQILIGHKEIVDGAVSLNTGTLSLKSGSAMLHDNMGTLLQGTNDLAEGTDKLAEGTTEFKEKTDHLDEDIQTEIDETLLEIMGDASETISFVSEKNTNVESVQFVLKTNDIMMNGEAEELVEEETREITFWDKLKDLFSFRA